jgi:hypothetical protein
MGLDYGFYGRTLGPLGDAIDTALRWIFTGGQTVPPV